MLIGNPYKFSIFVTAIEEWNTRESIWCNGVLLFCVDGELFPKQVVTTVLNSEIRPLKEKLANIVVDTHIYRMDKEKAFSTMCDITFPKLDTESSGCSDYRYIISPSTLIQLDCLVYVVSNGKQVRIMAAKPNYIIEESSYDLNDLEINEVFLSCAELTEIIQKLNVYSL